jgi:hypothetical protein
MTYAETMALRQMKKGDLVKHARSIEENLFGVILSKVEYEYHTDNLDSHYKILWRDGTISKSWDYDLEMVQ